MLKSLNIAHRNCKLLHEKYRDVPHLFSYATRSKDGTLRVSAFIAGANGSDMAALQLSDSLEAAIRAHQGMRAPVRGGGDAVEILGAVLHGLQTEGKLSSRAASEILAGFKGAHTCPPRKETLANVLI